MTDRPPWDSKDPEEEQSPAFIVPPLQPDDVERPLPDVPPPLEEVDVTWGPSATPRAPTPFSVWLARGWALTTRDAAGSIVAGLPPTVGGLIALWLAASLAYPIVWGQPLRGAGMVARILLLAGVVLIALPAAAATGAAGFLTRMRGEATSAPGPRRAAATWLSAMGVLLPFWLCGLLGVVAALRLGVLGAPLCFLFAVPLTAWACLGLYEVVARGSDVAGALLGGWRLLAGDVANVLGLGAATVAIAAASVAMCCAGVPVAVPVLLTAWAAAHEDLTDRR